MEARRARYRDAAGVVHYQATGSVYFDAFTECEVDAFTECEVANDWGCYALVNEGILSDFPVVTCLVCLSCANEYSKYNDV